MGLDMYIMKRPKYGDNDKQRDAIIAFVSWIRKGLNCTFCDWTGGQISTTDLPDIVSLIQAIEKCPIDYEHGEYIEEEVGYWRKANQIHRWFIENVQCGADDCMYHRALTKEDLENLKSVCDEVLANHELAPKLLPTLPGFFFGGTEYDKYYYEQLVNTSELCDRLIADTDFNKYELRYISSW